MMAGAQSFIPSTERGVKSVESRIFCITKFAELDENLYHRRMATVRIVRFSKPSLLRRVNPALFIDFARSFGDFFARNEVDLPTAPDPEQIPYVSIADSFMRLDPTLDRDLIDALYYLDSLSADANGDLLLDEARHAGFNLPDDDLHPVDVAVRVWMQDDGREFLKALQDRNVVKKFRSFQFCQKRFGLVMFFTCHACKCFRLPVFA